MFFLRPGVIGGWHARLGRGPFPARRSGRQGFSPCARRSADGGDDDSYRCAAVRLLAGATAGLPSREIPSSLPDPLETLGLGLVRTGKLRDSSPPLQIYPHVCKHCFPTYRIQYFISSIPLSPIIHLLLRQISKLSHNAHRQARHRSSLKTARHRSENPGPSIRAGILFQKTMCSRENPGCTRITRFR